MLRFLLGLVGFTWIELQSPLSVGECGRRAEAIVGLASPDDPRPLVGRRAGSVIQASRRIRYRNAFQTVVRAEICERAGGTRIRCRFGLGVPVLVFIGAFAWIGFPLLVVPAAAILALGRLLAAGDRSFIIDVLSRALEARPATDPIG